MLGQAALYRHILMHLAWATKAWTSLADCARTALLQAMRELYAVQSHPDVELAATAALLTAHQAAKIVDHDAVAKLSMQLEVRSQQKRLRQEACRSCMTYSRRTSLLRGGVCAETAQPALHMGPWYSCEPCTLMSIVAAVTSQQNLTPCCYAAQLVKHWFDAD
jgi:hypothetical protein